MDKRELIIDNFICPIVVFPIKKPLLKQERLLVIYQSILLNIQSYTFESGNGEFFVLLLQILSNS